MIGFVYKFLNENGEVIYIGSTGDMTKRMYKHFHDKSNGKMNKREYDSVKTVSFCKTKSRNDAYILEIVLIQKYKPSCNTASVKDGEVSFSGIDESNFVWETKDPKHFGYGPHDVVRSAMLNQYSCITKRNVEEAMEALFRHLPSAVNSDYYRLNTYQSEKAFMLRVIEYPDYWVNNLSKRETERMIELIDLLSMRIKTA